MYGGYRANNATDEVNAVTFDLKGSHELLNADGAEMLSDNMLAQCGYRKRCKRSEADAKGEEGDTKKKETTDRLRG